MEQRAQAVDRGSPSRRSRTILLAIVALIAIAAVGAVATAARSDYRDTVEQAGKTAASVARLLDEHTRRTIDSSGIVLDRLAEQGLAALSRRGAHDQIGRAVAALPQLGPVAVFDREGRPLLISGAFPVPPDSPNVADREFFRAHRDRGVGDHIGPVVADIAGGQPCFTLSRAIRDAAGGFAGVMAACLQAGYFADFYASLELGPGGAIALFIADGRLLVRQPPVERRRLALAPTGGLFTTQLPRSPAGIFVERSPLDGIERLVAYRAVAGAPLVVAASLPTESVLAGWQERTVRNLAVLFGGLVALGGLAWAGLRSIGGDERHRAELVEHVRIVKAAEEELRRSQDLYKAIAANIPNGAVAVFDRDHRYMFVDGRGLADIGLDPVSLLGRSPADVFPPETASRVSDAYARALAGEEGVIEIPYAERIYEARICPLHDAAGAAWAGLALLQDVTEMRVRNAALQQANAILAQLSERDGLLGIANRRRFDQALGQEWARAARLGRPLALLMIDVDFFKAYNDTYGHPRGDECLKRVVQLIDRALRRPSDFLARYGGEELVVLLPDTDADGARHVAQRIHTAIAAAGIPHSGSSAARCLTVSIGAAALLPDPTAPATALVEAADHALYAAKRQGRNRTVSASRDRPGDAGD